MMRTNLFIISIVLIAAACNKPETVFEKLDPEKTGISFVNDVTETQEHNVFTYQYYYNGNGVAVGDVNNDGLTDIFFTGNQTPSKLFLNKGSFSFEDVTGKAKVAGRNAWRTGANMVDINGDGLLDIYVCYSGFGTPSERANELFINAGIGKDGVPVFTEKAKAYGLDAPGTYSSQSAFFDYDNDGDLDMFLLNHANEFYSPFFNTHRLRHLRHPEYGNRLYRNDYGSFKDVSDSAGIFGGGLNFGLGISISDINNDGWPDIYVTNDFHEQDYLYLNNRDGSFTDICHEVFGHISRNTMGSDIADFNNDGLPDVFTLDMLPESNYRQKILQGADEYDKFNRMVDSGYGLQNNRNMLQLNRGIQSNGLPVFSEIGQLSGVSNTDWSWAALFADFDNDGAKDLFVTNGYLRESTNLDFMRYEVAEAFKQVSAKGLDVSTPQGYAKNMPLYELVKKMPSTKISNYAFRNNDSLQFENVTAAWGLDEVSVSSGASYADLDNDGALDLIVCNNNEPARIYRNNSRSQSKNNFIRISLSADGGNRHAIGAKVFVKTKTGIQMQEMYPVRGYQSSVDYVLNFGLGSNTVVDEITVQWSKDSATIIKSPAINTTIIVDKKDLMKTAGPVSSALLFSDITATSGIDFKHRESKFIDFKHEYLLPYQLSRQGPRMAKGDVNGDGLEDVFIPGAGGQPGKMFVQDKSGGFVVGNSQSWKTDSVPETTASLFFDADNDGDLDLYLVSGSNEWQFPGEWLQDRLYINDSKGNFTKAVSVLSSEVYNGSCVIAMDFDKDGDQDLFIGAGAIPGKYPAVAGNILLRNDLDKTTGALKFTDITASAAGNPLFRAGMVNDASWIDMDKDGWPDLVLAGDWMPIRIFRNENGKKFTDISSQWGLDKTDGFWHKILPVDLDSDGDIDLVAGNLGINTQYHVSSDEPLVTYTADFNGDGKKEPVMSWYIQGQSYPFNSRDELVEQMPVLNKRFLKYDDFGKATIADLIGPEQMKSAEKTYIYNTRSTVFINNGKSFEARALPVQAQFSMVNSITYSDYDGDGYADLLLAGNFFPFRVQQGRSDAGMGTLLKGDGKGNFRVSSNIDTGLYIPGDVRDMLELKTTKGRLLIISKNNDRVQVIKL